MEPFYTGLFGALASVTLVILLSQRSDGSIVPKTGEKVSAFVALRNNYVLVYAMMMGGFKFSNEHAATLCFILSADISLVWFAHMV